MAFSFIDEVSEIYYSTNVARLFAWPGLFKLRSLVHELNTQKFEKWINSYQLPPLQNVWVNAVNVQADKEEIYSYDEFQHFGYGEIVARSSALPGFISKGIYLDGGVSENPCLGQWSKETLPIFVSQLMMPHRLVPQGRISKLLYSWEFKAFESYELNKRRFKTLYTVYPMIDDVDSSDFGIGREVKEKIVETAYKEASIQLEALGFKKNGEPLEVCFALSGGGIRSGAHIGVLKAMLERNITPVKWSGTSGGAAFAVLLAGLSAKHSTQTA
jgi:predicted acylesterase/phospholipase RssA